MLSYATLSDEHVELDRLVRMLLAHVDEAQPAPERVATIRWELTRKLLAHLAKEDKLLYPRLRAGADRHVAATAARFAAEMGDLAETYRTYVADWPGDRIVREWPAFRVETRRVMAAMTQRIEREETILYKMMPAPVVRSVA